MRTAPGQTLIISTIVLGFLILSFILASTNTLNQETQNNLVMESKVAASAAATACMEQAMNRLGLSTSTYTGNETLTVASSTCVIRPITSATSSWMIETWAQVNNQYTRYRATLNSLTPITISSWTEIDTF